VNSFQFFSSDKGSRSELPKAAGRATQTLTGQGFLFFEALTELVQLLVKLSNADLKEVR
jgi:hypothetical protein